MCKLTKDNLSDCINEMTNDVDKIFYYHTGCMARHEIISEAWNNNLILSFDETDEPIIKVSVKTKIC